MSSTRRRGGERGSIGCAFSYGCMRLEIPQRTLSDWPRPFKQPYHGAALCRRGFQIGRASCRERGEISGVAGSLKKKKEKTYVTIAGSRPALNQSRAQPLVQAVT